ncbi:MAG: nucleotide exchange factor GrpE [Marinilabiliaceae bacterium]|nr:nucleotide exchange factor GrpE [Marinilabiliaceae bacterium]
MESSENLGHQVSDSDQETETTETTEATETAETTHLLDNEPIMLEISGLQEIAADIKKIVAQVEDFSYKDLINNRLHDELQTYKNGLRKEFLSPLLKGIIREYDRAVRQYNIYSQKVDEQNEDYINLLKQFENMAFALLDLLSDYDIEPFDAEIGELYSAKEHRIVEIFETDDVNQDVTIASCNICGFRDIYNDRVMRHAEVNIFKFKK